MGKMRSAQFKLPQKSHVDARNPSNAILTPDQRKEYR